MGNVAAVHMIVPSCFAGRQGAQRGRLGWCISSHIHGIAVVGKVEVLLLLLLLRSSKSEVAILVDLRSRLFLLLPHDNTNKTPLSLTNNTSSANHYPPATCADILSKQAWRTGTSQSIAAPPSRRRAPSSRTNCVAAVRSSRSRSVELNVRRTLPSAAVSLDETNLEPPWELLPIAKMRAATSKAR